METMIICQYLIWIITVCLLHKKGANMRGSRKFSQRVSNFDNVFLFFFFCFFFLMKGGRIQIDITISGSSYARQRNAIKMVFRWRANDGPTLNAGLKAT